MRMALAVAFMAFAAVSAAAQEVDREYLKRRLEEKRKEIRQAGEDLGKLHQELVELDERFGLPPEYRPLPYPPPKTGGSLVFSAASLWTDWDDSLNLGNGNGISFDLFPCIRNATEPAEEGWGRGFVGTTPFPFGVRYWKVEDELTGGDVDIISYRLFGFWAEFVQPEQRWGVSLSAVWGLTRYSSDGPGGDSDMGHGWSFEGELRFPLAAPMRAGAGISADLVNTRFNQEHTELTATYSALVSLEVGF